MKFPCFLTGTQLQNIEVDIEPSDTITTLKRKISALRHVAITHIRVSNGRHPLPDDWEVHHWKRFWVELLPGPLKVDVVDSTGTSKTITLDPGENTVWAVKERVYKEEGLHPPPILSLDSNLTTIKRANSTNGHWGVMALWQMRAAYIGGNPWQRN